LRFNNNFRSEAFRGQQYCAFRNYHRECHQGCGGAIAIDRFVSAAGITGMQAYWFRHGVRPVRLLCRRRPNLRLQWIDPRPGIVDVQYSYSGPVIYVDSRWDTWTDEPGRIAAFQATTDWRDSGKSMSGTFHAWHSVTYRSRLVSRVMCPSRGLFFWGIPSRAERQCRSVKLRRFREQQQALARNGRPVPLQCRQHDLPRE